MPHGQVVAVERRRSRRRRRCRCRRSRSCSPSPRSRPTAIATGWNSGAAQSSGLRRRRQGQAELAQRLARRCPLAARRAVELGGGATIVGRDRPRRRRAAGAAASVSAVGARSAGRPSGRHSAARRVAPALSACARPAARPATTTAISAEADGRQRSAPAVSARIAAYWLAQTMRASHSTSPVGDAAGRDARD